MLLADIVAVSQAVASTSARSGKTALLAETLSRLEPDEARVGLSFLSGKPIQRRLGAGYATVYAVDVPPSKKAILGLGEVDRVFDEMAAISGPGSKGRRESLLIDLMSRATREEQDFLRGLMLRNVRQGALEGVLAEAVAEAVGSSAERVRRAAMLEGDLIVVAARALAEGAETLGDSTLAVFTPVQPMLAKTAETTAAAIDSLGEAIVEQKLDGLRIQVHREGDRVAVFSRNLRDITGDMPAIVEDALSLGRASFVLDGEGLMVSENGRPLSFQESMSRPGGGGSHPLRGFFFDVLSIDGTDLIDLPLRERHATLDQLLPPETRVKAIVTRDPALAEEFFEQAIAEGFEGVVLKDPNQTYEAGRRGSGWLKVKPTHTLDLLVLAAEWGSGRRRGWLSNLHLGALGPDGEYVMLGKTFKGLTDEMLAWQTDTFLNIEDHREGHVVYLEPKIVYEIAFDGVQRSSRYPGGVALRFARVKRHRGDKSPQEIDTLETVRSFMR
jgi:DNA ligase-1